MKKSLLFLFSIVLLLASPLQALAFYSDVPETHAYYDSIKNLYDLGKLPEEDLFHPDEKLTKADFYKLLLTYGEAEIASTATLPYTDTDNNADYAPYLQTAIDRLILKPANVNPQFGPANTVAKHNALTIMFSTLGIGVDHFFDRENFTFTDLAKNSRTAPLAQKAAELGILETDNPAKFKMAKRITKGEAADYLYKILTYYPSANFTIEITQNNITSGYNSTEQELLNNESFATLLSVWTALKEDFINKKDLDNSELIFAAIKGMVSKADDKYTVFQEPSEATSFISSLSSEYEGIGIIIELIDTAITVVSPFKGSPAEEAGLKANDIIVKVNDESVVGLNMDEVSAKIKGPSGTTVKITVNRDSSEVTFTVKRDFIMLKTVESKLLPSNIGYISVLSFNDETYEEFVKAAEELITKKPKGLIIDLRNNPGGYLDVSVNMISLFTDEIKTAVTLEYSDGHKETYKTNGNGLLKNYKTVVLINEGSASASEIMAGALQDFKKATVIGTTSFGKGSVQEVRQFDDNSLFKYTISKWLTPIGRNIDKTGITPDKTISNIGEQDLQLDKAIAEF